MATRKRARQTHDQVLVVIADATLHAHKAKDIEAQLHQMTRDGRLPSGATVPNLRTIQRIVAEHRPPDPTMAWRVADASGEDAALILPVLAHVVSLTEGRETEITQAAATWVLRLRRAVPDLAIPPLWHLVRRYISREASKKPATDLDLLLAFAPWRSEPTYVGWSTKQRHFDFLHTLLGLKVVTKADKQVTLWLAETAIRCAAAAGSAPWTPRWGSRYAEKKEPRSSHSGLGGARSLAGPFGGPLRREERAAQQSPVAPSSNGRPVYGT